MGKLTYYFDEYEYAKALYAEAKANGDIVDAFESWYNFFDLTFYFEEVVLDFQLWLQSHFDSEFMIYRHYKDNLSVVDISDIDSVTSFVKVLNEWHTDGYCYTNDFSFDSKQIVWQGSVNLDLLQRLLLLSEVKWGYSFNDYIPTGGAYAYVASTVSDFYYLPQRDFLEAYLTDYLDCEDILQCKLESYSQEEQDLAYCLAMDCLEQSSNKYQKLIAFYNKSVA